MRAGQASSDGIDDDSRKSIGFAENERYALYTRTFSVGRPRMPWCQVVERLPVPFSRFSG
jgi:hypothetical protein